MVYKIVIQARAERDIAEAFAYVYDHVPELAASWYRRLKDDMQSLSEMPRRCGQAPEASKLGIELRQLIFGKRTGRYRIIFRILEDRQEVHILAIRHGARKPIDLADIQQPGAKPADSVDEQ